MNYNDEGLRWIDTEQLSHLNRDVALGVIIKALEYHEELIKHLIKVNNELIGIIEDIRHDGDMYPKAGVSHENPFVNDDYWIEDTEKGRYIPKVYSAGAISTNLKRFFEEGEDGIMTIKEITDLTVKNLISTKDLSVTGTFNPENITVNNNTTTKTLDVTDDATVGGDVNADKVIVNDVTTTNVNASGTVTSDKVVTNTLTSTSSITNGNATINGNLNVTDTTTTKNLVVKDDGTLTAKYIDLKAGNSITGVANFANKVNTPEMVATDGNITTLTSTSITSDSGNITTLTGNTTTYQTGSISTLTSSSITSNNDVNTKELNIKDGDKQVTLKNGTNGDRLSFTNNNMPFSMLYNPSMIQYKDYSYHPYKGVMNANLPCIAQVSTASTTTYANNIPFKMVVDDKNISFTSIDASNEYSDQSGTYITDDRNQNMDNICLGVITEVYDNNIKFQIGNNVYDRKKSGYHNICKVKRCGRCKIRIPDNVDRSTISDTRILYNDWTFVNFSTSMTFESYLRAVGFVLYPAIIDNDYLNVYIIPK